MTHISLAEARRRGQSSTHLDADPTYARLVMRRISPFVAWAVVRYTSLSADAVTWAAVLCGIGGGVALAAGSMTTNVIAVLLLQLGYLLDVADGEVARIRGTAGLRGTYLDLIGHVVQNRVLYGGAGYLLIGTTNAAPWAVIIALAGVGLASPFGGHARVQVTGRAEAVTEVMHRRSSGERRVAGGRVIWTYRRIAFAWNYPAAMNLFCIAALADVLLVLASIREPVVVPGFAAVFLVTLALKQLAAALLLLRSGLWASAQADG